MPSERNHAVSSIQASSDIFARSVFPLLQAFRSCHRRWLRRPDVALNRPARDTIGVTAIPTTVRQMNADLKAAAEKRANLTLIFAPRERLGEAGGPRRRVHRGKWICSSSAPRKPSRSRAASTSGQDSRDRARPRGDRRSIHVLHQRTTSRLAVRCQWLVKKPGGKGKIVELMGLMIHARPNGDGFRKVIVNIRTFILYEADMEWRESKQEIMATVLGSSRNRRRFRLQRLGAHGYLAAKAVDEKSRSSSWHRCSAARRLKYVKEGIWRDLRESHGRRAIATAKISPVTVPKKRPSSRVFAGKHRPWRCTEVTRKTGCMTQRTSRSLRSNRQVEGGLWKVAVAVIGRIDVQAYRSGYA